MPMRGSGSARCSTRSPFGPSGVHEQSGWSFQVVADDEGLALQTLGPEGWGEVYFFPPRPAFRVDIEMSNWWTCTRSGLTVRVRADRGGQS